MPIHDWTHLTAGTWHDFHLAWIAEIRKTLNAELLPADYYAQAEQSEPPANTSHSASTEGGVAVRFVPPRMRVTADAEMNDYVLKRRTIVVRHNSGDRIVALIEIVSPGNKSSRHGLRSFVEKAVESLYRGYHLLLVDLFPPGPRDPNGIHGAIWSEFCDDSFELSADEPLTLAAYSAGARKRLCGTHGRGP